MSRAAWSLPVPVVEALIERLAFEPGSMYRARILGGAQFFGWTPEVEALAGVYDAVQLNTVARGNLKRRSLRSQDLYPRPQRDRAQEMDIKPRSVREMDLPSAMPGWF